MLIEQFFLNVVNDEDYNKLPLQSRMIMDMVGYKANYIFADTIIDIKVKEHPDDWRTNQDVYTLIEEMKSRRSASFEGKYHLERLYESEYRSIDETTKSYIESVAKNYADIALKVYGWIKEEEKRE